MPAAAVLLAAAVASTQTWSPIAGRAQSQNETAAGQETSNRPANVPLFKGLGDYRRSVTTNSPEAQQYFDQGLAFLHAFNHDEAIRSFAEAGRLDPDCTMAWWGIAFASGPHINNPVVTPERADAAWNALQKARKAVARGTPIEKALVEALSKRYANPQPEDRKPLDEAFAAAMRTVWQAYPQDADAGAFFAEAMMDLRPWDLWTAEGKTQPGTEEVLETLEKVLKRSPNHPLALHLYIHAVEASPQPEKADAVADRLRNLTPALGHLVHMPSHIDVRRGRWALAADTNDKAIAADRAYREQSPEQGFYRVYMAHNHHMLSFAAMMRGQSQRSIEAIDAMARGIPAEFVKANAALVDGFTAMPLEVRVRFGKWDEVLSAPEPAEYLPIARALWRCGRAIAFAAKGNVAQAKAEQQAFAEARKAVSPEAVFGNNHGQDLMQVAEHLLAGEVLYREGKGEEGLAQLRKAVAAEDKLKYAEPPDWLIPTRHALGAALLEAGKLAEAEAVYRADLEKLPNNGWSLYGLAKSLSLQGKQAQAAEVTKRFEEVWADADLKINSSCLCLPGE
jgi:tetratricopeptide (TPR) repeat protein